MVSSDNAHTGRNMRGGTILNPPPSTLIASTNNFFERKKKGITSLKKFFLQKIF